MCLVGTPKCLFDRCAGGLCSFDVFSVVTRAGDERLLVEVDMEMEMEAEVETEGTVSALRGPLWRVPSGRRSRHFIYGKFLCLFMPGPVPPGFVLVDFGWLVFAGLACPCSFVFCWDSRSGPRHLVERLWRPSLGSARGLGGDAKPL